MDSSGSPRQKVTKTHVEENSGEGNAEAESRNTEQISKERGVAG